MTYFYSMETMKYRIPQSSAPVMLKEEKFEDTKGVKFRGRKLTNDTIQWPRKPTKRLRLLFNRAYTTFLLMSAEISPGMV